ncbi:MAG TPA: DinB family protein [Thermomicrobiaceae bacterium]|nr:DinB family protein [Thermomicrobiaceae bacterium]
MTEAEVYLEQIRAMSAALDTQLTEVSDELLYRRPGPSLNPIVWNYWHLLRVWDLDLNWFAKGLGPQQDAWHRGGYSERADYTPDGKGVRGLGIGTGYTDQMVDELRIPRDVLQAYQRQLLAETEEFLGSASDADLAREAPGIAAATEPVAARFRHTIAHGYGHIGELRFSKGMLGLPDRSYPRGGTQV